jgi:hypothetical protein
MTAVFHRRALVALLVLGMPAASCDVSSTAPGLTPDEAGIEQAYRLVAC